MYGYRHFVDLEHQDCIVVDLARGSRLYCCVEAVACTETIP